MHADAVHTSLHLFVTCNTPQMHACDMCYARTPAPAHQIPVPVEVVKEVPVPVERVVYKEVLVPTESGDMDKFRSGQVHFCLCVCEIQREREKKGVSEWVSTRVRGTERSHGHGPGLCEKSECVFRPRIEAKGGANFHIQPSSGEI